MLRLVLLVTFCSCHVSCMAVSEDMEETQSATGEDSVLTCTAQSKPGVQYRAVRWYKVGDPPAPRLSGLLTRSFPNGSTQWYVGVERQVELYGESLHILLPNVTCTDSGVYVCHLAAPVGEKNQEGQVRLTVTDCPDSAAVGITKDSVLVLSAIFVLMVALVIFKISYGSLRNMLKETNSDTKKEISLDAPLQPLKEKDLKSLSTLGPNWSTTSMKHECV